MSRLAKKPLAIPQGVTIAEKGRTLQIKGPKGELSVNVPSNIEAAVTDQGLTVKAKDSSKQARANAGTVWSLARNSVEGVTEGFTKLLQIEGVGYRAQMEGTTLVLSLGYVNPVRVPIPQGITASVDKAGIRISGTNKEIVGQVAAQIRSLKKPEPYKGKGIRYEGEVIRRKVGKKAATAA